MIQNFAPMAASTSEAPRSIRQVGRKDRGPAARRGVIVLPAGGAHPVGGLYIVPRRRHKQTAAIGRRRIFMNGNLYDILSARFPADRERPAIELPDGRTHAYGDLEAASARLAHGLEAAGARPGDRVMVQVEKTPEAVFLYLACLRAGLVYLPLNSGYRQSEGEYFLADAEPRVVVSDPASPLAGLPSLAAGGARWFSLDQHGDGSLMDWAATRPAAFDAMPREDDDLAAILYTSGTTGKPKGAMMSHRNLSSNALALHRIWGFRPDDRLLHALPIFHTHGL